MGKNRFNTKKADMKKNEKEFEDMRRRIMLDNKNVRANRQQYQRNQAETNTTVVEEVAAPVSHISDFLDMTREVIVAHEDAINDNNINLNVVEGTRKQANGIVFVKMQFTKDAGNVSDTLLLYYIEDRSILSAKKRFPAKDFQANILVINQESGNVLFNRFGYAANCIVKAKDYIDNIVAKTINRLVQSEPVKETEEPTNFQSAD